jgi:hypothetical protein
VAVGVDGEVVSPCGICRELITDYGPQAWVIVPGAHGAEKVLIAELLPNKYTRLMKKEVTSFSRYLFDFLCLNDYRISTSSACAPFLTLGDNKLYTLAFFKMRKPFPLMAL